MFDHRSLLTAAFVASTLSFVATTALASAAGEPADARPHQRPGSPSGPHHGLPPEAFEACQAKAAGDACTVAFHDQQLVGTCVAPPADGGEARVFCMPANMPPPPVR